MTIKQAIGKLKLLMPGGQWDDETMLSWLSEVEGTVLVEVLLMAPSEVQALTQINDATLTVPYPFDKVYTMYMLAKAEFANGEYDRSANTMAIYNIYFDEYRVWVENHLRPAYGEAINEGYYLTAYGLAKQYGFEGTEKEFLESLVGQPGQPGKIGPQGPAGNGTKMFYGESQDGIIYTITDENAPKVAPGSGGSHVGKGQQLVFVPRRNSESRSPAIRINEGARVEIRMRKSDALSAELSSAGYLKAGVPYLMTFCGLYWLIDSWVYEETGVDFKTDETLTLENGVLSVNIAVDAEQDNTLPISSAAVYTEIGNIDAILKTI